MCVDMLWLGTENMHVIFAIMCITACSRRLKLGSTCCGLVRTRSKVACTVYTGDKKAYRIKMEPYNTIADINVP